MGLVIWICRWTALLTIIEFKLYFTSMVTRSDIVSHFELGLAAATRSLKIHKERAPDNLAYHNLEKPHHQSIQTIIQTRCQ